MKECDKCLGTGKLPKYPNPYCILTPSIIDAINRSAPECDKCDGKGYIEEEG